MEVAQHKEMYQEAWEDYVTARAAVGELLAVARYHAKKAGINFSPNGSGEILAESEIPELDSDPTESPSKASDVRPVPTGIFANMKQVDAAEAVLRESSKPLNTRDIAEKMAGGGFPHDDLRKLRNSIFTTMTRKPKTFEKAGQGFWKLTAGSLTE